MCRCTQVNREAIAVSRIYGRPSAERNQSSTDQGKNAMHTALILLSFGFLAGALADDVTPAQQQWIDKGAQLIKDNVGKQAKLSKELVEWLGSAAQSGVDLGATSAHMTTDMAHNILDMVKQIGEKGIKTSTNIASGGLELVNSASDLSPSFIANILHKVVAAGQKGVTAAGNMGTSALDKGTSLGDRLFGWVNDLANKATGTVSGAIGHGKDRITTSIDKGVDRITGGVDSGSKFIQNILDKFQLGNRKPGQQQGNNPPPPAHNNEPEKPAPEQPHNNQENQPQVEPPKSEASASGEANHS